VNTLLIAATWRAAIVGRWTARIVGTLMALFFLAFVVGEGPPPLFKLSLHEAVQFLSMAGLFCGLLLAWKWEGWGALISLVGFVLFLCMEHRFTTGWIFLIPAAAAVLHVLCWWRIASGPPATGTAWEVPRKALWIIGTFVALFILFCANEIFGQPPLMTARLRPSADLVGHWHARLPAFEIDLLISGDGQVSGRVGDTPITNARIANDRSWFGVLMHWRDPYKIRGAGFTAELGMSGEQMSGELILRGQAFGLTLRKQ
jgi:hypothetical protein